MIADDKNTPILVADIGGTNARFALASVGPARSCVATETDQNTVQDTIAIHGYRTYPCADFSNPIDLVQHYMQDNGSNTITAACLAVAGPVRGNHAYLTNLGWDINGDDICHSLAVSQTLIANDFQALARSVTALDTSDLLQLHGTEKGGNSGPIAVMGPGTGFGLSQVFVRNHEVNIIPTEGGHASFVPAGDLETAVFNEIQKSMGRVTVETLISGIGIQRIYRAICSLNGITPLNYEPSTISQIATEGSDQACRDTLSVFCNMLGGVAADVALTQGATGGVYLGGGILPKIADFVNKSDLVQHFLDKPPMEDYIANIPVWLIADPEAALIGASLLSADHTKAR